MSKSYISEQEDYERRNGVYMYARSISEGTPAADLSNSAHRPVKAPALPSASYKPKISVYNTGALPSGVVNVYETPEDPTNSGKKPDFQKNRIVCYRSATVCLAVMCVLLLAAIIGLGVKYSLNDSRYSTEVANIQSESVKLQYERDVLLNISAQELGWTRFGSSIYFLPTYYNVSTWHISRQDCINRKADLVIINSKQELEFLSKYQTVIPFWIGAASMWYDKVWRWVDGTSVNPTYWFNLNDIESPASMCATQNPTFQVEASWVAVDCNKPYTWICERVIF